MHRASYSRYKPCMSCLCCIKGDHKHSDLIQDSYYLIVSAGLVVQLQLSWVFCSDPHRTAVKTSAELFSSGVSTGKNLLELVQLSFSCWQNWASFIFSAEFISLSFYDWGPWLAAGCWLRNTFRSWKLLVLLKFFWFIAI